MLPSITTVNLSEDQLRGEATIPWNDALDLDSKGEGGEGGGGPGGGPGGGGPGGGGGASAMPETLLVVNPGSYDPASDSFPLEQVRHACATPHAPHTRPSG